jgi:hypothetical protein
LGHRAYGFLDRNGRVYTVQVKQIDMVRTQSFKTGITRPMNEFRPVIDDKTTLGGPLQATFSRQKYPIPEAVNALTDKTLVVAILVNSRRVKMSHANFNRAANRGRGLLVITSAIPAYQAHASQTDRGNLFAGISQYAFLQACTPFFRYFTRLER